MFDMFDLFRQAQGGAAFDNLARAYGMTPDQLRAATAALTPAFAQGFQRRAASDDGAQRFAEMFRTETYARAFEAQAAALDPATRGAGDDALAALFGSKEVSRAVAAQAAAASGVQAEIVRKVLPVLASILVGGFMKAMQGAQVSGAQNPFGQMFGAGAAAAPSGPANPFQPWLDAFSGARDGSAGTAANPMGDMMGEFMRNMFGGAGDVRPDAAAAETTSRREPPREEPRREPPAGEPAGRTPFDEFADAGRAVSQQNAEAMSRIFDAFFGADKKA